MKNSIGENKFEVGLRRNNKLKKHWKFILKYTLNLVLAMCIVLSIPISKCMAISNETEGKKAIIFIMDEIILEEILNINTPNIDILLQNGSIGLMNTRAKSSLKNRGSAYLSLGMGVRTLASTQGKLALERNETYPLSDHDLIQKNMKAEDLYKLYTGKNPPDGDIINIAIGNIEKTALAITPNNQVGLFGKMARENRLVIGAIGNSDLNKPAREFTMLGMDENGIIPIGCISSDLLTYDPNILGGIKLNQKFLLEKVEDILPNVDILFIDYGDTVRIENADKITTSLVRKKQKNDAVERADEFLGKVIERVDLNKTLIMIISPNPSKEMITKGNFALTPIIMYGDNIKKGLLTSNTTRREGLVTNFDFGPTIFNFFGVDKTRNFIGERMKSINNERPIEVLVKNQEQSLYLRKYRKIFHWSYIILVGITLLGFYLPQFIKWNGPSNNLIRYLGLTVLAIPLTMMTVSLFGYKSIVFDLIYVIGGGFLIVYILNKIFSQKLMIISILSILTSLFILIDIFFLDRLMIISPLGSDVIAGGRFYGIGNDYMGILLGSSLLGVFSLLYKYKTRKSTMVIIITSYMFIVMASLSPFFGANIGGTLSAMIISLINLFIIFDKKFSLKKTVIAIVLVIIGGFLLGLLDIVFNPNPTHGGKAVEVLIAGGLDTFFEIVKLKLRQVFWNLINASWNIILLLQVILIVLLYKFKNKMLRKVSENYSNLFKGLIVILLGSIVIFLLNDTGTIAAALTLIYALIPLGMLINEY